MIVFIYFQILILTLYGDLTKRILSPDSAQVLLYGAAILVLIEIFAIRKKILIKKSSFIFLRNLFVLSIALFFIQLAISPIVSDHFSLKNSLSAFLYIVIPFCYVLVCFEVKEDFKLFGILQLFFIFIVPINIVGLIQCFHDPNFFISVNYSEMGGIVSRNSYEGSFLRFPSIFASADRYSQVAFVQFYFSLIYLFSKQREIRINYLWGWFNFSCGVLAMGIAGARAKMLVAGVVFIFLILMIMMVGWRARGIRKAIGNLVWVIGIVLLLALFSPKHYQSLVSATTKMPAFSFLKKSIEERDPEKRIQEAIEKGRSYQDASLFGIGLGNSGAGGRPAEFGLKGILEEGGLVFGTITILSLSTIALLLLILCIGSFMKGFVINYIIYFVFGLNMINGLLAGLTSAFELSSGILMCVALGIIMRDSTPNKNRI